MTTQAIKKKNYEVKIKTNFVLKGSNEIQNQIQVTYLNLIYHRTAGARTLNVRTKILFLITIIYNYIISTLL